MMGIPLIIVLQAPKLTLFDEGIRGVHTLLPHVSALTTVKSLIREKAGSV
jgi:hypothetical protein